MEHSTPTPIVGGAQRPANVIELAEFREEARYSDPVRDRTLRRIRLLRAMLDGLEIRIAATNPRLIDRPLDIADVGTDELLDLAGLWFPWAFHDCPPPPWHWRGSRREDWRDWCRRAAAP